MNERLLPWHSRQHQHLTKVLRWKKKSYQGAIYTQRYFVTSLDVIAASWNFLKNFWITTHSVLERIWVKFSYLSQWLPQGERGPPKESKSRWIEINFQKFWYHSEIFFCFTIHKKLNKSCSLNKLFLFLKKKCLSKKKLWKKIVPGRISIHHDYDALGGPLSPCGSHWLR